MENKEYERHRLWKMQSKNGEWGKGAVRKVQSMENAKCGQCKVHVWEMWSVENMECVKCGVTVETEELKT